MLSFAESLIPPKRHPLDPDQHSMTISTTFDAFSGDIGHLRLHSPSRPCPFEGSAKKRTAKLEQLLLAFEHATGWQMGYQETSASRKQRQAAGDPTLPIAGQLTIEDLSQLLPPGVPAASRIYCEKLVEQFNLVVAELDQSRMELHKLHDSTAPAAQQSNVTVATPNMLGGRKSRKSPTDAVESAESASQDSATAPPANLPLTSHSVNIVPLTEPKQNAVFEWYVEPTGLTRFAIISCDEPNSGPQNSNRTSELIAARATFLTECRHRSCDETIQYELKSVVERLFPGDANVRALCGSVNSLTGDLVLAGCNHFLINSSGHIDGLCEVPDATLLRTYLPHGQHLVISSWPEFNCKLTHRWIATAAKKLRTIDGLNLNQAFDHHLNNAIPSLPAHPEIALAITRV